jgi:acetoin utilization deacetylase AcuC-like enzyme
VLNVPLPAAGISTEAFVAIWRWLLPYAAAQLRPDVLIVSAGFDYAKGDPVGDLGVDVAAAAQLASIVSATAAEQTKGRIAYLLEGGYSVDALVDSIAWVARQSDRPAAAAALGVADDAAIPAPIVGIFQAMVRLFPGTSQGASN